MTTATPRRRVLRPSSTVTVNPQRDRLHTEIAAERENLRRWMNRLKRAFNAVTKHQNRLGRLERKLAQLNGV